MLLAYAPGGLAEMTVVSLALGIDVVFVASHHIVRIMFVVLVAPICSHFMGGENRSDRTDFI